MKIRTLIEGPEWDASREAIDADIKQFDDAFRFPAYNIAAAPLVNTTPFLSEGHRILRIPRTYYLEFWVYFRIEPGDDACTLLWIHKRKHDLGLRAG